MEEWKATEERMIQLEPILGTQELNFLKKHGLLKALEEGRTRFIKSLVTAKQSSDNGFQDVLRKASGKLHISNVLEEDLQIGKRAVPKLIDKNGFTDHGPLSARASNF